VVDATGAYQLRTWGGVSLPFAEDPSADTSLADANLGFSAWRKLTRA
jgi:hypothetical protein